jgi:signal transduction histidine kinase
MLAPSHKASSEQGTPRPVPGTVRSALLMTAMAVLSALFAGDPRADPLMRALYFAMLFGFFHSIGRREPDIRVLPFRLIECGFLVLTLGFIAAALLRGLGATVHEVWTPMLLANLERGAVFLLGLTLISYGIILWVPHLLESQRVLRERYDVTRGELTLSEKVRSRMEKSFVEADRLHALGQLAAGVAHDLRNPLAIIKAAADSMARGRRGPEDLRKHTEVICRNIDRAERTISGLLDLGRPRDFSLRDVDLTAAVMDVVKLVEVECRRRRVRIETRLASVVAVADPKLLSQALLNVVLNAIQASPPNSAIDIRARAFSLAGRHLAALIVEDRGAGIDPDARAKLFSPFFTTKQGGTGLGLLSSRRVMNDMGGNIGLFPRGRTGARAILLLPHVAVAVQEVV